MRFHFGRENRILDSADITSSNWYTGVVDIQEDSGVLSPDGSTYAPLVTTPTADWYALRPIDTFTVDYNACFSTYFKPYGTRLILFRLYNSIGDSYGGYSAYFDGADNLTAQYPRSSVPYETVADSTFLTLDNGWYFVSFTMDTIADGSSGEEWYYAIYPNGPVSSTPNKGAYIFAPQASYRQYDTSATPYIATTETAKIYDELRCMDLSVWPDFWDFVDTPKRKTYTIISGGVVSYAPLKDEAKKKMIWNLFDAVENADLLGYLINGKYEDTGQPIIIEYPYKFKLHKKKEVIRLIDIKVDPLLYYTNHCRLELTYTIEEYQNF